MVFLGGAVLANIVSRMGSMSFRTSCLNTNTPGDGGQGEHVDLKAGVARTGHARAREARCKMIEAGCSMIRKKHSVGVGHTPRPNPRKGGPPRRPHLMRLVRGGTEHIAYTKSMKTNSLNTSQSSLPPPPRILNLKDQSVTFERALLSVEQNVASCTSAVSHVQLWLCLPTDAGFQCSNPRQ